MVQNKRWVYKSVPEGIPKVDQNIATEATDFDENQSPPEGGLIVKVLWASLDPYLRGRMRPESQKSYFPPLKANTVIQNSTVSKVLKSDNKKFKEGDIIFASADVAEYAIVSKASADAAACRVIPKDRDSKIRLSYYIGVLGMPGLSAWSSFYEIGQPKKGETFWVSAASGPVGSIAGQLAKHEGLKVIGSVGSDQKLEYITKDLGFDGGFNYKNEKPVDAMKRLAPDGIDIYFDNVGGEHLEAAIEVANNHARFVECGQVSEYNTPPDQRHHVNNLMSIVFKRLRIQGFIVGDPGFGDKYRDEHIKTLSSWIAKGEFTAREHITDSIDGASQAFVDLLTGKNDGKAVIKVAGDEE